MKTQPNLQQILENLTQQPLKPIVHNPHNPNTYKSQETLITLEPFHPIPITIINPTTFEIRFTTYNLSDPQCFTQAYSQIQQDEQNQEQLIDEISQELTLEIDRQILETTKPAQPLIQGQFKPIATNPQQWYKKIPKKGKQNENPT